MDLTPELFNILLAYYGLCGVVLIVLAFLGGKATTGARVGFGVIGVLMAGYAGYVYFGNISTVIGGIRLAILPILLVGFMIVAMVKGSGENPGKTYVSPPPPNLPPPGVPYQQQPPQAQFQPQPVQQAYPQPPYPQQPYSQQPFQQPPNQQFGYPPQQPPNSPPGYPPQQQI